MKGVLLIIVIVVIVILLRRRHLFQLERKRNPARDIDGGDITAAILLLVAIIVAAYLILEVLLTGSASRIEQGAEYGFFGKKKTSTPEVPTRTNYGNPMKAQSYIPRSGVPTTPKTDASKIFRRA